MNFDQFRASKIVKNVTKYISEKLKLRFWTFLWNKISCLTKSAPFMWYKKKCLDLAHCKKFEFWILEHLTEFAAQLRDLLTNGCLLMVDTVPLRLQHGKPMMRTVTTGRLGAITQCAAHHIIPLREPYRCSKSRGHSMS